jgi:hypothetical protein
VSILLTLLAYRGRMTARGRLTLPIRMLGVLAGVALAVSGCTRAGQSAGKPGTTGSPSTSVAAAGASSSPHATQPASKPTPTGPRRGSGTPVHVSLREGDGQTYGVAMPLIAYFSAPVTDASIFDQVTTVTVNGRPAAGAWYFERSSQSSQVIGFGDDAGDAPFAQMGTDRS